jgi:hypothetical protein
VLDVEHHASEDGQRVMAQEREVGKDRGCGTFGGRRHEEKHRHKHLGLGFLARIGGRDQLPVALTCQKGHIDASACVFNAGEDPRGLWVDAGARRCGRVVGAVMGGLKGDVAIDPKTEDHAERLPKRDQAGEQEKRCGQSPKHRHASFLCVVIGSLCVIQDPRKRVLMKILTDPRGIFQIDYQASWVSRVAFQPINGFSTMVHSLSRSPTEPHAYPSANGITQSRMIQYRFRGNLSGEEIDHPGIAAEGITSVPLVARGEERFNEGR